MKTLAHIALILTAAIAKAQYTYRQFDVSDLVLIGTVTHVEELSHVGWIGRRDGSEHNEQAHFFRFTIRVSRILKGACPSEFDCVCPSGLAYISQRIPASTIPVAEGTTAVWFVMTSSDGTIPLTLPRLDLGEKYRGQQQVFHVEGAAYGLSYVYEPSLCGHSQIILKDDQIPNRGNVFLDMAELFVHNAAIDPDHRYYYFEQFTDLSPVGFGREDRSKQEQDMFKAWMDAHLTEALNPKSDAEKMDEYALRIRFGQLEYCDRFTDLFVKLKGKGLTAPFPLSLGSNDNGLRIYRICDPRLARELALGFMYATDSGRKREVCKALITRFGEDHFLDVGILEAMTKLMDWPDTSPYDETIHAYADLTKQIEIARFRLNN